MDTTAAEAWALGLASFMDSHLFTSAILAQLCYALAASVVGLAGRQLLRLWMRKYSPMAPSAPIAVATITRPTPAAQDPPPQTPQDPESSECGSARSAGSDMQAKPAQGHRRTASWGFPHQLWRMGVQTAEQSWSPGSLMEKLHEPWGSISVPLPSGPSNNSHGPSPTYGRVLLGAQHDSAFDVMSRHENDIRMLMAERDNAEKQYVTENTRSRAVKEDLERSLAMQEQLESRLAEEMSLRQSLEASWRQREASLLAEVASATSQTIRSQTQTCDLEDELAHFQLRARQMASDSSVISGKVGRTGRTLAETSLVLKSMSAHLVQLEESVSLAEAALRQARKERQDAINAVAGMESKLQQSAKQLAQENAKKRELEEDVARLSTELERVVKEFAEFERQQFCTT